MHARCSECGAEQDLKAGIGGKLGGIVLGAVLGPFVRRVTGSRTAAALASLVAAPLGALLGHYLVDERLLPACPACQGALELVAAA